MPKSGKGKVAAFPEPTPEETLTLTWNDGPHKGTTVVLRNEVSFDTWLLFMATAPEVETRAERLRRFGNEALLEWNLVDREENDIPANGSGMNAIPPSFAWDIVERWISAINERIAVSAPLEQPSQDGDT